MIEMKHLNIQFEHNIIFNDTSFRAYPGQMTCLVGKSGCGKTTFLKALLYEYETQTLKVDGIFIDKTNRQDYLLEKVSYIDQFGSYFENMKIIEHFQFISMIKQQEFDIKQMKKMFHLVGLDSINIQSYPSQLSIGQRKRFLFALALYKDSPIIILDEPTASLDETTKKDMIKVIKNLKNNNKYIILTSHDDWLIKQCDVIYTIEDHKLHCNRQIETTHSRLEIQGVNRKISWKYFFYKNPRQWFQFILTVVMGMIMTVMLSVNVLDSFLQEAQLSSGVARANKAEMYVGRMDDATIASGSQNHFFTHSSQYDNLDIEPMELDEIRKIEHIKNIYPFDVIDTIDQSSDILTTTVIVNDNQEIKFDYQKETTPIIVPYYPFQNIKVDNKKIKGVAISENLANKLGISHSDSKAKIKLTVFIPVQQYLYEEEVSIGDGMGNVNVQMVCQQNQTLVKEVQLDFSIDHIISTDDYYNEFLDSGRIVLVPGSEFNQIMKAYNNQNADNHQYADYYQAKIEPYQTKNYLVEIDRVKNLESVETKLISSFKNIVVYDQYNSVIDTTEIYRQQRKDRLIFIVAVIIVAIVLYSMVLMNLLDSRKKEMKMLSLYGLSEKNIRFILRQNMIVQILLSLLMIIPSLFLARRWGFLVVTQLSIELVLILYFFLTILILVMIFVVYDLYSGFFRRKVLK